MLENRKDYSNFEETNLTGLTPIRVKYADYKQKYSKNKTVTGSYDSRTKTIEVYFTKEEIDKLNNLGNNYRQKSFDFILKNLETQKIIAGMFSAKTLENATKNAKKWCKLNNYELICEVATNRNIQSYGATEIIKCTL